MKRLSKNLLAIVLSDVTRRVLGFLAVAYLARKVGTAGFGAVNIGLTVLSYAMMVSTAGLNAFGTRAVARGDSREIVSGTLSLRAVNAVAAWFIVLMIALFFVQNRTSATLIAMFSVSLFAHAFLLDWYFQGKEEMGIIGLGRIVSAATYLLMLVLVCPLGKRYPLGCRRNGGGRFSECRTPRRRLPSPAGSAPYARRPCPMEIHDEAGIPARFGICPCAPEREFADAHHRHRHDEYGCRNLQRCEQTCFLPAVFRSRVCDSTPAGVSPAVCEFFGSLHGDTVNGIEVDRCDCAAAEPRRDTSFERDAGTRFRESVS